MRTIPVLLAAGLVPALAPVAHAQSQGPAKPAKGATTVTLDAKPAPVVFGSATELSGRLSTNARDVVVRLEADATRPYGDRYEATGVTATTSNGGRYTLSVKPQANTQFRVVAQASPPVTSAARLVLVRMLTGVRVSDTTPRRGALVRFSGTVLPAHDGGRVVVQRRSSTGRFVTVARTLLRDLGDARSRYGVRVRVRTDGTYRVKAVGDADHINGLSRLVALDVR